MASSTAPTIDANGITAPTFPEVLAWLQGQYRSIYGSDVYLEPDGQDGQFLAIIARAISDTNAAIVAAYQSYSPSSAQGNALSSNVKINGIARDAPSESTVDLVLVGVAGTVITNGIAVDQNSNRWALPASVTIPPAGEVTATATCTQVGAIGAMPNTINRIGTPTLGWQTVNNPAAATEGAPVESDAALRQRQRVSTAIPSLTVMEGIVGAVASLSGVLRYAGYENDTSAMDSNGIPSHSISLVVEGGDATAIAQAIARKKTPGAGTYGTTVETVNDTYGRPMPIRFFRPTEDHIQVDLTIKALAGYTTVIGNAIKVAVANYINGLPIGGAVLLTRLYLPANLYGTAESTTYEITVLKIGVNGGGTGTADIPIAFNHVAACLVSDIALAVVS
ncbi:baseplate J/gp47 family protein [Chitiniphilus shinanonensis]|uniref:baseplate J/gp47 family protein n=1 Tax=Chitiniphilus shinanonensis TaxID=553088 RepID=UPI00305C6275